MAVGKKRRALPRVKFDVQEIERERHDTIFSFRLSASEKERIHRVAATLGVTTTDYLLGLHRQMVRQLKKSGRL